MEQQEQPNFSQPQEVVEPQGAPELGVADLQNIRVILETAARRGTFQAQEMSGVGRVYDRLNNFLNALQSQQEAQQPADTPAA